MRLRALLVVVPALAVWGSVGAAAQETEASEAEAPRAAALSVEGRRRGEGEGGTVVAATLTGAAEAQRLVLRCRDGARLLGRTSGAPPSVSLTLDGEEATFNASCEAEAGDIRASRSVLVTAAPDDESSRAWIFGLALGVTVAAAVAIVVSMLVASANSPVNVGVPMVDGW